jgi:DHA2 family multidrug resistance protein
VLTRFIAEARAALVTHLPVGDPQVEARLQGMMREMMNHGATPAMARARALGGMAREVQRQASMLAFEKVFLLFGVAFLLAVPLIMSLRWRPAARGGGGSAAH